MIELEAQNGDYSMTWRWLEAVQASLSENP
jgi:hypothetical protein